MEPTYYKRELTPYEAEAYLKGIDQCGRASWEQTRMAAYCSLAPWSKDLKLEDVMKFAWDGETKVEAPSHEEMDGLFDWGAKALAQIRTNGQE